MGFVGEFSEDFPVWLFVIRRVFSRGLSVEVNSWHTHNSFIRLISMQMSTYAEWDNLLSHSDN